MKKFLALTALVLGLASCQTEPEGLDVNVGGEQLVTVNVTVPETETRANAGSDSAVGAFANGVLGTADDNTTMRYILQVYYKTEENSEAKYTASQERLVEYSDGKTVNFEVRLVPKRNYQFVVWADVVSDGKNDTDNHYNTSDLKNITLKGEWNAMDESRDAFTATELIENYSGSSDINITLKRPFAKLRVVTTDMKALNNLGIEPTTATVEYKVQHYNAFNALYGKAISDSKNRDIKHENYTIASYGENIAEGADMTLFSDYFFAENDAVQFELKVYDQNGDLIKENAFNTDIYVKRNYLTTIKGNILTENNSFDVTIDDVFAGENGVEDGVSYTTVSNADELLDAINKGVENITLEGDINLNDLLAAGTLSTRAGEEPAFVVAAGKKLTIDLNGYTISETKTQTAAHSMITNKGTLTILDSKGNGKISYKDEGNGGNYVSNTIQNSGILTIEGGIFENNSVEAVATNGFPHPIDNSGKLVINGGTFTNNANYSSMRIWCTTDDDTEVTINGGTFNGCIDLQNVSQSANKGILTINGGTFNADTYTKSAVRLLGFGTDVDEIFGYINGGTFNAKIKLNNYVGGEFNSQVFFIKGGTFAEDPSEFVVPGYKAEQENGVYVVRKPQALIDFENAIANGDNVTLNEDITLIDPVVVAEGKEVTINLNGKTLDIYTHKSVGGVLENNGTLAIEGGVISSKANNGGSAIANNGTLTVKNATLNGAPNADGSWPSYTVNNTGTMTLENSTITSKHGSVSSYGEGAVLTLNNCTIDMAGIPGFTSHGIYTYSGGKVVVNGGTYVNKATDQNSTGASVINGNVEVNAGTFTGRIENYYGTPVLKGGTYSVKPNNAFVAEGYKVIEENGKYNVVLDAVDDVVSSTETLEEAIAAGNDTIALNAGEYVIPSAAQGKTVKFVGTGNPEDTKVAVTKVGTGGENCDYGLDGSTVTFENITITTNSSTYIGYARCNGTYKNCIINGTYTLYGDSVFENCTFNVSGDVYNIWTWGAPTATFTNCTFNCDGKAMLLYGTANTKLTMNNCVFNDNGDDTVTGKAAIETGNDYNKSYELTVNNATVNGFAINPNGIVTGTTLWANKNSMPADKLKVTVDGLTWKADGLVEDAEGNTIATNVSGLKTALTEGTDVTLEDDMEVEKSESDTNGYGATGINQNNGGTIDGGGNDFGADVWGTWDSAINTTGGTIKNINIVKGFRGIFVNHNSENCSKVYLENVTIDGPTYTISCDQGTNKGLEATDSTFNGWTSYAATIGDVKFVYCTFGEGAGYAFCRPYAPTEFVGCEFEEGYTIDPRAAVTFENCTLNGVTLTAENIADLVTDTAKVTIK